MAMKVKNGDGADEYLKTSGAGTSGDPRVTHHNVDMLPADPFGANADAAVVTDIAGSISGKLRGIVTLLAARLPTLVSGRMPVDGSGVTQPVSAASLPLPTNAAAEHTAANSPHAARLSDGTAFYKATTPSDTQPVSVGSLPLPTGAATEATLANVAQDGAAITGQSLEAGGSHVLGWLASIRKAITDRLPAALVGGRLDINIGASSATVPVSGTITANAGSGTLATSTADGQNAAIGATTDAATANTVIGRLKQLLSRWPASLGQTTSANSLPVVLPSDQTVPISGTISVTGAVDTELTTGDLDSGAGTDTRAVVGLVLAASGGGQLAPGDSANGMDVDVTRVPSDPFGANADALVAAGAAGSISAKLRRATQSLEDLKTAIVLAASSARIGKVTIRNSADSADIDPLAESTFTGRIGEVQASPTANTVLDRLKALLTGIVLAAGDSLIGRVKLSDGTTVATVRDLAANDALNVAIVDASGGQITSFGGGTQYAEDATHVSGDLGTMALTVRKDTAAATAGTDGDYQPPITDASGRLHVNVGVSALPSGAATETTLGARLSESDFDTKTGSLTETAPTTDTASSGLNGRLQRIAQRLTTLIGLLPAALGQTTKANSLPVVLPSDYQAPILPTNTTPTLTSVSSNNADMLAATDVSNYRSGTLTLTGTWSATVSIQASTDGGTTWITLHAWNLGAAVFTTGPTNNNSYLFSLPVGAQLRIRTTSYSSGTVAGTLALSSITTPLADLFAILAVSSNNSDGQITHHLNDTNANARPLGVSPHLYDESGWNRQRGVAARTLLSSSARTTTTNSSDQTNYNWHGLLLVVDVTSAGTGSITPSIQVKDSISGNYKTVWTAAAALTANGTYVYALTSPKPDAASYTEVVGLLVGRTWRLAMTHNNANTITYSASADMVL